MQCSRLVPPCSSRIAFSTCHCLQTLAFVAAMAFTKCGTDVLWREPFSSVRGLVRIRINSKRCPRTSKDSSPWMTITHPSMRSSVRWMARISSGVYPCSHFHLLGLNLVPRRRTIRISSHLRQQHLFQLSQFPRARLMATRWWRHHTQDLHQICRGARGCQQLLTHPFNLMSRSWFRGRRPARTMGCIGLQSLMCLWPVRRHYQLWKRHQRDEREPGNLKKKAARP